jgi:hypothetical protein
VTCDKKSIGSADADRLESFGIYQLARRLFEDFWSDSEISSRDYRGRELSKQQIRSLDSICANMEEGFGRGFGKETAAATKDFPGRSQRKPWTLRTLQSPASLRNHRPTCCRSHAHYWRLEQNHPNH